MPEKNIYSAIVGYNVLYVSVRSCWLMVLLSSFIFLFILFIVVMSLLRVGCWSLHLNCRFVYFFFQFCQLLLHVFKPLLFGALSGLCFVIVKCPSLSPMILFALQSPLPDINIATPAFYLNEFLSYISFSILLLSTYLYHLGCFQPLHHRSLRVYLFYSSLSSLLFGLVNSIDLSSNSLFHCFVIFTLLISPSNKSLLS